MSEPRKSNYVKGIAAVGVAAVCLPTALAAIPASAVAVAAQSRPPAASDTAGISVKASLASDVVPSPLYEGGPITMTIPAIRNRVSKVPIWEGVGKKSIDNGIGHFRYSQGPGRVGNFAVAGHRATHGEPFADLPSVKAGSYVIVETRNTIYIYKLDKHKIVPPRSGWVTAPVPKKKRGSKPAVRTNGPGRQQLITLVTCVPRWGHTNRFIYWGHLVSAKPKRS